MNRYKLAIGFASILMANLAFASPDATGAAKDASFWDKFDTDKDGFISKEESAEMEGLTQLFDKIDTSKDGKLAKDELNAIHGDAHGHDHGHSGAMEGDHGADHPHGT